MKPDLPKLTQDVRIEEIKLDATIDANNYFENKTAEIRVTGKDEAGAPHSVVVRAEVDLTGINATKADSVDLTGKKVEAIEREAGFGHGQERGRR
jgi:nitrogenase molybdenum-iron protein alpha/beta subunit